MVSPNVRWGRGNVISRGDDRQVFVEASDLVREQKASLRRLPTPWAGYNTGCGAKLESHTHTMVFIAPQLRHLRILSTATLLILLSAPVWILLFFYAPEFPLGAGIVLVPTMAAVSAVMVRQVSRGSSFERRALLSGLALKLAAAGMFTAMVVFLYHGGSDSFTYYRAGQDLSGNLGLLGTDAIMHPFWGTNFITMLCGAFIYLVPSYSALAAIFALLSFWGQFFVYRAFTIAMPDGDRFDFALLIFLLPSLAFWSATVGKESVIIFGIGLCVYGYACASARANPVGYLISGAGLFLVGIVRPHMGAMLAVALATSVSLSSTRRGLGGMLNKMVGIPLLLVGMIYLVTQAQSFVGASDFQRGVGSIQTVQRNSQVGGSAFSGSLTYRLALAPLLLFRPFPWEATTAQAGLASLEGIGLATLFWRRRRNLSYAVQNWRNPFMVFILIYSVQFIIVFSVALSNFGILSRQRVMLLPIGMMLLCLPPARRRAFSESGGGWRLRLRVSSSESAIGPASITAPAALRPQPSPPGQGA